MKFFLGVDGGGTNTISYIANQAGHLLGVGKSGPSNYQVVGADMALSSIEESISKAYKSADIRITEISIDAACFGLAGIDTKRDYQYIYPLLEQIDYISRLILLNDSYLALAGGNASPNGIALIAGTGSIAVGINKKGQRKRVGGWGYIFDDKGSGYNIVINAFHAIFEAYDGRGEKTALNQVFCSFLEIDNVEDIINRLYVEKMSRKDIAGLAKLVFIAAHEDDLVAINIIKKAGYDLASLVSTVIRELDMYEKKVILPLVGGVFKSKNKIFIKSIKDKLVQKLTIDNTTNSLSKEEIESEYKKSNKYDYIKKNHIEELELIDPILNPAAGGLLIAFNSIGIPNNYNIIDNLKKGEKLWLKE